MDTRLLIRSQPELAELGLVVVRANSKDGKFARTFVVIIVRSSSLLGAREQARAATGVRSSAISNREREREKQADRTS